jgi:hypothetical protein
VQGRFESAAREAFDDGWTPDEPDTRELKTSVTIERARSIISRNDSPDVGFSQSINPYRGCEHGCMPTSSFHPAWISRRNCLPRPTLPSSCAAS